MYQFLRCPHNAVQLYKPDTLRNSLYTNHQLGSLFKLLTLTPTEVLVKDASESWDYVAATVVIV
jgi:hypothetical protein